MLVCEILNFVKTKWPQIAHDINLFLSFCVFVCFVSVNIVCVSSTQSAPAVFISAFRSARFCYKWNHPDVASYDERHRPVSSHRGCCRPMMHAPAGAVKLQVVLQSDTAHTIARNVCIYSSSHPGRPKR